MHQPSEMQEFYNEFMWLIIREYLTIKRCLNETCHRSVQVSVCVIFFFKLLETRRWFIIVSLEYAVREVQEKM